jgi:integrase
LAENGLPDPGIASAIERTKGVKLVGVRAGNWLLKEQANELLNAPDPATLKGKRDRAILALLVSCGLRSAELVCLELDKNQLRDDRWVIPHLLGERKRVRVAPVPAWVKERLGAWTTSGDSREKNLSSGEKDFAAGIVVNAVVICGARYESVYLLSSRCCSSAAFCCRTHAWVSPVRSQMGRRRASWLNALDSL